jgi:hypothetical protein
VSSAKTLVTNERGEPYTDSGLRTMVHRLATMLSMKPGLTIHGLRHSLGEELHDLGIDRDARKAVMAHESDAANKAYERDGDRSRQADRAVRPLNRRPSTSTSREHEQNKKTSETIKPGRPKGSSVLEPCLANLLKRMAQGGLQQVRKFKGLQREGRKRKRPSETGPFAGSHRRELTSAPG